MVSIAGTLIAPEPCHLVNVPGVHRPGQLARSCTCYVKLATYKRRGHCPFTTSDQNKVYCLGFPAMSDFGDMTTVTPLQAENRVYSCVVPEVAEGELSRGHDIFVDNSAITFRYTPLHLHAKY